MKIKDKLAQSGIDAGKATIAQILSAIGKPDSFEVKKSEVGVDLANLVSYVGVSHAEIAKRLGWKPSRVSRVLSGKENLTLRTVNEIVSSVDYEFDVIFRPHKYTKPSQPWVREQYEDYAELVAKHCETRLMVAKSKVQEAEAMLRTATEISRRMFQRNATGFSKFNCTKLVAANEGKEKYEALTAAA